MIELEAKVREIAKDLVSTLLREETMVPVCSIGPLLEYIELLQIENRKLRGVYEDNN